MSDFIKLLDRYVNRKIALYGLGTETEKALARAGGRYEIIGLLDGFREEGMLYGLPILSIDDAVALGVSLIVVVARPASCRAITKRIGAVCEEKKIGLFDVRGHDLLEKAEEAYDFAGLSGVTKEELADKIGQADVISFDLFDTLVMRRTLYPEDVIELTDCRLKEKGIKIKDFGRRRLAGEKELSKIKAPVLQEIYEHLLKEEASDTDVITAEGLAETEWEIDCGLIVPRKEVCDVFRAAVAAGKKVYIVSDTYYKKRQLAKLLAKCDIYEYTDILVSCDYATGKIQKLFGVLRSFEKAEHFLHIGDDICADIEAASKFGIAGCRLYSGRDLLEAAGGMGIQKYDGKLSERIRLGMLAAELFNSPFCFETQSRRIRITNAYDIGYILCAPVVSDFVLWFHGEIAKQNIENVWFGARDGYLVHKMYAFLKEILGETDDSIYFLTSRAAAVRGGVQSEKDIQYIEGMKFSGTLEDNLWSRFQIHAETVNQEKLVREAEGLLKYQKVILESAEKARKNYQKYINDLKVKCGDIAFFDFVAKGTTQMYLQQLIGNHIKGFYFMQLEPDCMSDKGLDIQTFYGNGDADVTDIYENYYMMEPILTAPHPSVSGFGEDGTPVYAKETRAERDIRCAMKAQQGIWDYFREYLELCPQAERQENLRLSSACLGLIRKLEITDADFCNMTVEDPFFNRMTNMADIL